MGVGGMPPVTQLFASSSSSQFTSSPSHTEGQSRTGYGRQGSLRSSASLQDFSTYWNESLPNGVPRSPSFGSTLTQHAPKNDGGVPTLTTIKSNLVRRSSGSVPVPFCSGSGCTRGRVFLALVALLGTILFLGVLWGRNSMSRDNLEYVIVIDCGSTGTRAHVYGWTREGISGKESLPVILHPLPDAHFGDLRNDGAPIFDQRKKYGEGRAYRRMETDPGLDKLLHNESGVKSAIRPLIQWAAKQIPLTAHQKTRLFLLATAGLRRLPPVDSTWLLDHAWFSLVQSPFICRREWVRVITGREEAYFGWIALNYNLGRLGHIPRQPTFGALDLGGSSLEVTFEPEDIPTAEYLANVTVGSVEHRLYAHSHPGFGLNDGFEKSVAFLVGSSAKESGEGTLRVSHPCLNAGYRQPFECSSHCLLPSLAYVGEPQRGSRNSLGAEDWGYKVELVGKPNWAQCQSLVQSVINVSGRSQSFGGKDCEEPPCALGEHQPQPRGQFFALAGFFVVYNFFGLTSINTLNDLLHKGQQFCKLNWEEAQQSVVAQPSIDRYCFRASYTVGLIRQGLHLSDEQVMVGSGDFAWTLGAALYEAGALLPANLGEGRNPFLLVGQSGLPLDVHSLTFLLVIVILAILLLTCSWHWRSFHPWHRPYLPLFVTPTVSSGPFSWFSPIFHSQGRSSTSPVAAASPPGADTISVVGRSQLQLAMVNMQLKGGSRLQSRRTQSRDDLSAYVSPDNAHTSKVMISRELSPVRNCTSLRHDFSL